MSIREDTPFSEVFSEFFGSTGWVRLGSPLISLNVKVRILNHMVSSSKESFLCSSETFLKQKHPQTVHFTQPVAFKTLSICFHPLRNLRIVSALGQTSDCCLLRKVSWAQQPSRQATSPLQVFVLMICVINTNDTKKLKCHAGGVFL